MGGGARIPKATRQAIQSMRGLRTASEVAKDFGVSDRSVIRIWTEDGTERIARDLKDGTMEVRNNIAQYGHYHAIDPEMVQMLTVRQYLQLIETREYYRAMRDAYPNNCAWGNLEEKYNRQLNEVLRIMGSWFGLERQKEPQSSADLQRMEMGATVSGEVIPQSRAYVRDGDGGGNGD